MFIENDENSTIVNLLSVKYFLPCTISTLNVDFIRPGIRFVLKIMDNENDRYITWKFHSEEERDKTLDNIRQHLRGNIKYSRV